MTRVTRRELSGVVAGVVDGFDLSPKTGRWTFRRSFYYRHGGTAEGFMEEVSRALKKLGRCFSVVECGEVWKPFRGGAALENQSHWRVVVEFDEEAGTAEEVVAALEAEGRW